MALSDRLAQAPAAELGRALAKGARALSRMRPDETLRGHTKRDDERALLRRAVVRHAWEQDADALLALVTQVSTNEDGIRHLFRALNNLRLVQSEGALLLTNILVEAIAPQVPALEFARHLAKLLPAIDPALESSGFIARAETLLAEDFDDDEHDVRTWLLQELVALELRNNMYSEQLIQVRGPLRPQPMPQETYRRLVTEVEAEEDPKPWSRRLAAIWLLAGADEPGLALARKTLERAYEEFPLEALAAVEEVNIATSYDEVHETAEA